MITKHFGSVAASTLKNMDIERLPLLVLIYKLRGSTEIFQVSNLFWSLKLLFISPCSYRIKMDENGAQESHMDFYAQFDSIKA